MTVSDLFSMLQTNLPIALLAGSLAANVWQYRDARAREREHLATAMTIAPLAQKLTDTLQLLQLRNGGSP